MKTNDIPLKSPIKLQKEMPKKFSNFSKIVRFLGHFLKKQCFWKMGVAGIKQLPHPFKIASFLESFIQKCWPVSDIQSFEVENYFFIPYSLWNCAFLTIFDFKALYFWSQSIFLNETFRSASPLRFPENEAILDVHGSHHPIL